MYLWDNIFMRVHRRIGVGLLLLAFLVSGCYGPFRLTRKLHQWNGQVGDKWAREAVFIVLVWVPVYGLATLGDALVFNSIEFWTGDNPVASAHAGSADPRTKWIAHGEEKARLTRVASSNGEQFTIEQYKSGKKAESLRIQRVGNTTLAMNEKGDVLFSADSAPDGSVVVKDADGKQMAYRSGQKD